MTDYPKRSVRIEGATAIAVLAAIKRGPSEFTTVREADEAGRALSDPENAHCCPLCGDVFRTAAFVRHAPSCIEARAPAWERQRDRDPGLLLRYNTRTVSLPGRGG